MKIMLDDFIRHMIQAAIELFPIDAEKKSDMLQKIMNQKKEEKD